MCCSDLSPTLGGDVDLRSALHLHRVASLWEVPVTEPGAVGAQLQPSAGVVPLLEKGHLRAEVRQERQPPRRACCDFTAKSDKLGNSGVQNERAFYISLYFHCRCKVRNFGGF